MCSRDLPDMYALGLWAYISGKSLVPMLQLLLVTSVTSSSMLPCIIPVSTKLGCLAMPFTYCKEVTATKPINKMAML